MTQSPNPFQTMRGYDAPSITQFSVFLDNKVGKLLEVLRLLDAPEGCTIRAISVIESSDHAVVRLITDNAACAHATMRERGLAFSEMDVLVVELSDTHTIASMCACLLGAELNIHFMYPLMMPEGRAAIALAVDDPTFGGQILLKKSYTLLGEADLTL
jgi:hypothetical protein